MRHVIPLDRQQVVPRHLCDLEPRGDSIAWENWNGVGWVENGPPFDALADLDDGLVPYGHA